MQHHIPDRFGVGLLVRRHQHSSVFQPPAAVEL
jgi:hypothetical protein